MKLTTNLPHMSLTRGQMPETPADRARALLRRIRGLALWAGAALALFVVFAWLSLPTRAMAWRLMAEARKQGFIVDIADLSVSPLGNVTLYDVAWTFEPSRPDQVPSKFLVSEVEVDVSLWALLMGEVDVEIDLIRDEGTIHAEYARSKTSSTVKVDVEDLPLYDLPKARQALNAPLQGLFALKVELEIPDNKLTKATGFVQVTCAGCRIGDGETRLYIPGSKAFKDGIPIPEIDLGTFVGKMVVDKGVAKTDGPMETTSDHISLAVEGSIKLRDPIQRSRLDLIVKVNLTEALQKQSERLRLAFQGADPKAHLAPPEQGLGYRVGRSIGSPRFYAIGAKSAEEVRAERRARVQAREEKRRKKKERSMGTPARTPTVGGDGEPIPALPPPSLDPPSFDPDKDGFAPTPSDRGDPSPDDSRRNDDPEGEEAPGSAPRFGRAQEPEPEPEPVPEPEPEPQPQPEPEPEPEPEPVPEPEPEPMPGGGGDTSNVPAPDVP